MSATAWVIIGILGGVVLLLLAALWTMANLVGDFFGGLIVAMGGPDIRKRKK